MSWTAPSSGTKLTCDRSCQYETHHNLHRPHRALEAAAPLKPLPDLGQYRVRRQARVAGLINEYRLVARGGRGFRHGQAGRVTEARACRSR
jgi:hypothetical protein